MTLDHRSFAVGIAGAIIALGVGFSLGWHFRGVQNVERQPSARSVGVSIIDSWKAKRRVKDGVEAFSDGDFGRAESQFGEAVELDPGLVEARLYLARSTLMRYDPEVESLENAGIANLALDRFKAVLGVDPSNVPALQNMAGLYFNMGEWRESIDRFKAVLEVDPSNVPTLQSIAALYYYMREMEESKAWHAKVVAVQPDIKESYYTIGVICWSQSYDPRGAFRAETGMRMEDPGPIRTKGRLYRSQREALEELAAEVIPLIDEGLEALNRAIEIDPDYDDAMAYVSLLYREKADFADSDAESDALLAQADEWVQKTFDTRKRKADKAVLDVDPSNVPSLQKIADLYFDGMELLESKQWHAKVVAAQPDIKESHFTIGLICWTQSYEPRLAFRAEIGMQPEDPGPIRTKGRLNRRQREALEELAAEVIPLIDEGLAALNRAIEIDPDYEDALGYASLLYRENADFADSDAESDALLAQADEWLQKALDTRKRQADIAGVPGGRIGGTMGEVQGGTISNLPSPPLPPPPPPPLFLLKK